MSRAPFSKPDVNDVVSSSHLFKIRSSLNHWSRGRLPNVRDKHLFGLVVIALLLLGLQLTACGNAESPLGSASPTSQPNTSPTAGGPGSTSASTSTTGPTTGHTTGPTKNPTTGPTTGSTVVPVADPSSFTVSQQDFVMQGIAGQKDPDSETIPIKSEDVSHPLPWSVSITPGSVNKWLSVHPTSGTLDKNTPSLEINVDASNVKANLSPGCYMANLNFTPVNPTGISLVRVYLAVSTTASDGIVSVVSLDKTSGPASGGTSVTITGTSFTCANTVKFGSSAAKSFKVLSDTQITAISPAGNGIVDVTVTNPVSDSLTSAADQFTYNAPPSGPTVSSISPTSGPAAGGTDVTIMGTGFIAGSTSVSFGGTAASNVTVVNDTTITATSPVGTGKVNVTVTTPNGNASVPFTYNAPPAPPTVSDINPSSGPAAGSTNVTITGTGFIMGSTSVSFGGTAASNVTVNSDTQITATSPASTSTGTVQLTVTTPNGTASAPFTYT